MKERRQRAIVGLLRNHSAHTQRELADQLMGEGFPVTQATISRDIQELGVVRRSDGYLTTP
ncbi:MAG: arginine repressor, partial [Candidatus Dormibacteraceae bacterium]